MSGHDGVLERDLALPRHTLDQKHMRLNTQSESSAPVFSAEASLPEEREQVLEDGLSGEKLTPSPSLMQRPSADPTPSKVDRVVAIRQASDPGFGNIREEVLVRANNFPIELELEDVRLPIRDGGKN
ncbi:hypothetical protein HPP92_018827 [Vanilla planifolia]|uniref:Uncharacterized protein n=1 Tax=Vanilla planifolia TaxID=51239 RepID=A0A835QGD1_VANPL|nr:hypothetical protein HPP92_018827 [Vanilla planifolia]